MLARHLALPHGIASADTFRRVFQQLDAQAFNQAFLGWVRPSRSWAAWTGSRYGAAAPGPARGLGPGPHRRPMPGPGYGGQRAGSGRHPRPTGCARFVGRGLGQPRPTGLPAHHRRPDCGPGWPLLAGPQAEPAHPVRPGRGARPQDEATGWASHTTPVRWQEPCRPTCAGSTKMAAGRS